MADTPTPEPAPTPAPAPAVQPAIIQQITALTADIEKDVADLKALTAAFKAGDLVTALGKLQAVGADLKQTLADLKAL